MDIDMFVVPFCLITQEWKVYIKFWRVLYLPTRHAPAHRAFEKMSLFWNDTHPLSLHQTCGPNSPHLNQINYTIWGVMKQRLYQMKVHDADEMKQHILYQARGLEQSVINKCIGDDTKAAACQSPNCI